MGRPPRAVFLPEALSLIDTMQICLLAIGSDWHIEDGAMRKQALDLAHAAWTLLRRAGLR
jgi:hypothetical protein